MLQCTECMSWCEALITDMPMCFQSVCEPVVMCVFNGLLWPDTTASGKCASFCFGVLRQVRNSFLYWFLVAPQSMRKVLGTSQTKCLTDREFLSDIFSLCQTLCLNDLSQKKTKKKHGQISKFLFCMHIWLILGWR